MTEKAKNTASRMAALPFLALWSAANIGGWLFTLWLWEALRLGYVGSADWLSALFLALVPGMISAAGQQQLMQRGLKKSVRAWLPVSFGGYLLSAAAYAFYISVVRFTSAPNFFMLMFLFVPVALVQAVWLHRRVQNAWLWVVGAIVSAVLFALPLQTGGASGQYLLLGLAAVLQGVVTGSVMRALWSQEREKAKPAFASSDGFEQAHSRLDDLSEVDNPLDEAVPQRREQSYP
jgi:hypothetical protein